MGGFSSLFFSITSQMNKKKSHTLVKKKILKPPIEVSFKVEVLSLITQKKIKQSFNETSSCCACFCSPYSIVFYTAKGWDDLTCKTQRSSGLCQKENPN